MSFLKYFLRGKFLYACPLYDSFFKTVSQINENKRAVKVKKQTQNKTMQINYLARNSVLAIQMMFVAYIIIGTTAILIYDHLSPIFLFALCDFLYLEGVPHVHRIWFVLNCCVVVFSTYLFYFCNDGTLFSVLKRIYRVNGGKVGRGGRGIEGFFLTSSLKFFKRVNIEIVQFLCGRLLPLARVYQMIFSVLYGKNSILSLKTFNYIFIFFSGVSAFHLRRAKHSNQAARFAATNQLPNLSLHLFHLFWINLGHFSANLPGADKHIRHSPTTALLRLPHQTGAILGAPARGKGGVFQPSSAETSSSVQCGFAGVSS